MVYNAINPMYKKGELIMMHIRENYFIEKNETEYILKKRMNKEADELWSSRNISDDQRSPGRGNQRDDPWGSQSEEICTPSWDYLSDEAEIQRTFQRKLFFL